ncbi:hypothetical protein JL720_2367 [Aureococcus anophagefferens]|nr:hypothetical protein JL720_2367 [Aureococcus anophagefferens]
MLTFDALSPRFALLGLGPSWMLMDGVFCQLATFDRTQPEGLALATYLGAVSALANTVVVPAHAAAQRKLRWPTAGSDGAVFLAFAINGSLVACFLGACLAARDRAPLDVGRANAVMGFAFSVVAAVATACALGGRPRSAAPCVAIALAAAVIRGLDGYCTPLFYREIHAVSGSVAVLQWSGILAIWVVNAGVWVTLVAVALGG